MGVSIQSLCFSLFIILAISGQAYGFGAGNIASLSSIEGQNWRHGDIEDALLNLFLARGAGGQKFSKLDVKRVYFGNWLRDYSQAVDVGTVKYVSAEAIRILIWVLGFMSFGYGTGEFEVTTERLGCYQPTEHIDNPQGYAEGDDARNYDTRLRGPVDEERELSIDPRTGLKYYIASEDMGIDTSANLIRNTLGRSIKYGRRYARSGNKDDLYEALRLLGTGLHCLEDYAAHSNYTELSLIELGENDVFPHVGRDTMLEVQGARDLVYPIVTGTFGGVDFFHSVLGEFTDKAMQSEMQSLEGVIAESENDDSSESVLQGLLSKIPSGLFGDSAETSKMDDFKAKADEAKHNTPEVSPREPEEWTRHLDDVQKQIYPVLEWHDNLLKAINEAIEKIPVLPELIEQIQNEITIFVFSVIAPYVLPIIRQVKSELETGSSEVIQSSQQQQHIVFNDDSSSNPTHSMLSKDHFSNVLNEPAGRIASSVVKWTVPQLMQCWDDEDADIDRTLTRIISGVFHHPALREYGDDGANEIRSIMFSTVEEWWNEKGSEAQDSLREQLSRDGVFEGKNHKEGVQDCGHGCGKPLALPKVSNNSGGESQSNGLEGIASQALGGGALGGLVGGLVGGMGSMILNDANGRQSPEERDDSDSDSRRRRRHHSRREDESTDGDFPFHSHEEYPSGDGYAQRTDQYYSGGYSRPDYSPNPPMHPPPMQGYQREEYQQYQQEGGGYYRQERREEYYESSQTEYVQTESRYDYGPPRPAFPPMEQPGYGGGFEQGYQPGYGQPPPPRGFDEYERPSYPPQDGYGGRSEERVEYVERRPREDSRDRSGSGSGSDEEHSHRRHRHHHHHHHEEHSGSDSD
ncbi:Heterokaryon incompatibility Het-C [Penicillium longicatenatum]|nr:Heterokaryon incompatibility Het-C [Penicillium longicatenatum]